MWHVYVIQCEDGSIYNGITQNIQRRFFEHKNRKGGFYTKKHTVKEVIFTESFSTKIEALKRERQIKGWRREKKIALAFGLYR